MRRALLAKAFRDGWLLLACLAALLFGFTWLQIWLGSMISLPEFAKFLSSALPKNFERLSPVPFSEMATSAGRIAIIYAHPLVLFGTLVWAIARGSDCVSGEIGRGTMEMLLAQPISRSSVYVTQAAVAVLGAAILAAAVWCGTAIGLATVELPERVAVGRFIAADLNLFARTVCLAGMAALFSSCDSQRWRTVGLMTGWYVLATICEIVGRVADGWQWLKYASFLTVYTPEAMVARPEEAWSVLAYKDQSLIGLGLGGGSLLLLTIGLLCYVAGAVIFNRRELPAPI